MSKQTYFIGNLKRKFIMNAFPEKMTASFWRNTFMALCTHYHGILKIYVEILKRKGFTGGNVD